MSFSQKSLAELCTVKQGKYLSPTEMSAVQTSEMAIPVVGGNGVLGYTNKASHSVDVPLVTCRGSQCGLIQWVEAPVWVSNNAMACDTGALNRNQFLRYLLNSATFEDVITGSAQPQITLGHLTKKVFDVCPEHHWNDIVGILGSLDDRITLLRETNATLEAIAQALFKSWFVDFDPVRAKMEGRTPEGMDEATAALFPDGFETSELGEVPRGWRVCAVEEFADRVGMGPFGSNIKVETFVESGIPVISGQHLKQLLVEDNTFNFITPEHASRLAKSCVQAGDVIFTHAGSIGQVSLLHKDAAFTSYVLSQRQFFLRCNTECMSPEWIALYFKSPAGQHQLLANTSQVGVPSIARPVSYLRSIRLVVPPPELNQRFASIAGAINDRVMVNRKQFGALTQIRDTLLPRLISGQLRLPEAQAAT
jgi:type I restriction enzyme S subunit